MHERVGDLGRVRRVADRVAPAQQHLQADVGHGRRQGGEALPGVLGEEPERDVVGRAAPALQREQLRCGARDVRGGGEQVAAAHPGGQQRLVRVAERRVGDGHRCLRHAAAARTPRAPARAGAVGTRPAGGAPFPSPGSLSTGSIDLRTAPVRSVDRRLGEIGEQPGAAVGGLAGAAAGPGRSSMNAVVIRPAWKSGSSRTAARNGRFVETPRMRNSAIARRARRTACSKLCP